MYFVNRKLPRTKFLYKIEAFFIPLTDADIGVDSFCQKFVRF